MERRCNFIGWVEHSFTALLVVFSSISPCFSQATIRFQEMRDSVYYFKAFVPASWTIETTKDLTSFWRIWCKSPKGDRTIGFYATKINGDIDLEKFAAYDMKMFDNLGDVTLSQKLQKGIEKRYFNKTDRIYAKARFFTDGTFGYIILAYNKFDSFDDISACFDNFESFVPFWTNAKNRLSGQGGSDAIGNVVVLILLFAVPVGIGLLGYATRHYSWGVALNIILPLVIGGFFFKLDIKWWGCLIIAGVGMALMGAGRVGFFIWLEE